MGCDIHWVVEQQVKTRDDTLIWIGVLEKNSPRIVSRLEDNSSLYDRASVVSHRNYAFFAALAGVRGPGPDPRGLPDDASETTKVLVEWWDCDGHSHSWCSLREFISTWLGTIDNHKVVHDYVEARLHGDNKAVDDILTTIAGVYELDGDPEESGDKYRVVFWFDN